MIGDQILKRYPKYAAAHPRRNYDDKRADQQQDDQPKKPICGPRVPDRWNDYTAIGQVIPKARLIAFKTPLKPEYFAAGGAPFGIKELTQEVKDLGGNLGMVIDLTYTTKYYNPMDLEKQGIEYKKIFCPGRDFRGLEKVVVQFVTVLKEFFRRNKHNDKIVGIHCTHGINRTGYLVCRYLHEVLGWPVEKAIRSFETARGHSIERDEYVEGLKKLSLNA